MKYERKKIKDFRESGGNDEGIKGLPRKTK